MTIFENMQKAVEAAQTSQHPTSKVGAYIASDAGHIAHPNYWPDIIAETIGTKQKIGNASGTIHAETACLLHAGFACEGADMYSTDPSCPNCAKNMAEAGIAHLYIDHKGFEKYYAKTRMKDFEDITLPICKAAGIGVTKVFRKEKRVEEILPTGESGVQADPLPTAPWAAAYMKETGDEVSFYRTFSRGLPYETSKNEIRKYNFFMQPLNRILMFAARNGYTLDLGSFKHSRVPTARELVNCIGAGMREIAIEDMDDCRDDKGKEALSLLMNAGILKIRT